MTFPLPAESPTHIVTLSGDRKETVTVYAVVDWVRGDVVDRESDCRHKDLREHCAAIGFRPTSVWFKDDEPDTLWAMCERVAG